MRFIVAIVAFLFSLWAQAHLIQETSITLAGHNPEKWGLKHIKSELGEGYFKFNELIDINITTAKISKKKFTESMKIIKDVEKNLLKDSKLNQPTCYRKLIIESKQKANSISNTYCLDHLKVKNLALITKTIQQLKN